VSRSHFLGALALWALIFLASPGVVDPDGSALVSSVALVPWALACSRPGRRAFLAEWLAAALGFAALMGWAKYVWAPGLLWIGIGQGFYAALAGVLLRRLAPKLPLVLAVPLAWTCAETWRYVIPQPLGLGWWRLGHALHAWPELAGSARVWGVMGCSAVLATAAGALAQALRTRRARCLLWALAPLGVAALLAALVPPPRTTPGPRLLLVQPGFPQERKSGRRYDPRQNFLDLCELTTEGLAAGAARGEEPPDLVCWGETMLGLTIFQPELREALEQGLSVEAWRGPWTVAALDELERAEDYWIREILLGAAPGGASQPAVLPSGTSFLAGHVQLALVDHGLRRRNAVSLWDAEGLRGLTVGKVELVPGAETLYGLEDFSPLRDFVNSLASYIPDMVPFERTGSLELRRGEQERWRLGASVCFDNAFVHPYTGPLASGELDFHLVVSNEAWYLRSWELDQMVAFSRMAAIASGRALVRATNSGVSLLVGPDGRDLARLLSEGQDRMVSGTLSVQVPVPERRAGGVGDGASRGAPRPPFVRWEGAWRMSWMLAPLLLALIGLRLRRRGPEAP